MVAPGDPVEAPLPDEPPSGAPPPVPVVVTVGAGLVVSVVGAVRDLSDSGLIVRLTRGRGWIAVLCALLGGIVTLNVLSPA